MSWAQWFNDSNVPGVYRNKWFERHHMQHAIARWDYDKTAQATDCLDERKRNDDLGKCIRTMAWLE